MKLRLTIDTKGLDLFGWKSLTQVLRHSESYSDFSTDISGLFDEKLIDCFRGFLSFSQLEDIIRDKIHNFFNLEYDKKDKVLRGKSPQNKSSLEIERVTFNNPATIVFWKDGTKTVVKCQKDDIYNKEQGLALCIIKKVFSNKGNFNKIFKKWCTEESKED